MTATAVGIDSVLKEARLFDPPVTFAAEAHVRSMEEYERLHREAEADPDQFWAGVASDLHWFKPWNKVLEGNTPQANWFAGGQLNVSYNCLDRHVAGGRANKAALLWEGEPGDTRTVTYRELLTEVSKMANVLTGLGIRSGDRVAIYMGMLPELAIAMLACARIGAPHTVVFAGFPSNALAERIRACQARIVITQDAGWRRGRELKLKASVTNLWRPVQPSRRSWFTSAPDRRSARRREEISGGMNRWPMRPTHFPRSRCHPSIRCFFSTPPARRANPGKPKGLLHATVGYSVGTYITSKWVSDLRKDDIYWCTADIGWITGHSYIVYGPLENGATCLIYEGDPVHPEPDRCWRIIDKHNVSVFYTAPTAIRVFMRFGNQWPTRHDLRSLRLLGSVGEPINPEVWMWYREQIGRERCPIVDTWWQTETGMIMIAPLPGAIPTKPGSATRPFPGVMADVVTRDGTPVPTGSGGCLVITKPWPGMLSTLYGDPDRDVSEYWSQIPGLYFTGDGARKDEDGYFWVMGRIDDVMNVSGHRLSSAELESALVSHDKVVEAAVVARPDERKGEAPCAFVVLQASVIPSAALESELKGWVAMEIGPLAKPDVIRFVAGLPKTSSGKIMRRLLRGIVTDGGVSGDTTTLEDLSVLAQLRPTDSEERADSPLTRGGGSGVAAGDPRCG